MASTSDLALSPDPTIELDSQRPAPAEHDVKANSNTPAAAVLRVNPADRQNLGPTDLSLLDGILDRIQAMGFIDGKSSVYDQIGFKTDDREIYAPPAAHLVASIEGLAKGPPLPSEPEVHKAQASD
jgi:hypothetical protein